MPVRKSAKNRCSPDHRNPIDVSPHPARATHHRVAASPRSPARRAYCGAWVVAAASLLLAACGAGDEPALEPLVAKGNGAQILAETSSERRVEATATPPDPLAAQALAAINEARAQPRRCGDEEMPAVGPVKWQAQVAHAALIESEWMQSTNSFAHAWPDGTRVGDRLTMAGYPWVLAYENIAAGFGSLEGAMRGWIESPSHCRALMNGVVRDVGVAVVPGAPQNTYSAYWTMVLALR